METETMDIDKLTIGQLKELAGMLEGYMSRGNTPVPHHYPVGEHVFIRTVTYFTVGLLVAVTDQELVLENASWVAETKRFADSLKDGVVEENEPFPDGRVLVGRGAVIDCCLWPHNLLREQV